MKPKIDSTTFGSITIGGRRIRNDVILSLSGEVRERNKKLSKKIYGTSHIISLDEAKDVYEEGVELLIIGTGRFDSIRLSDEAGNYFKKRNCDVKLVVTSDAIRIWNESSGKVIGLFHVTC